jgi:hypothetical protein
MTVCDDLSTNSVPTLSQTLNTVYCFVTTYQSIIFVHNELTEQGILPLSRFSAFVSIKDVHFFGHLRLVWKVSGGNVTAVNEQR